MKITKRTADLICVLERIIGSECYNPNAYDGWSDIYGCSYRYPVYYNTDETDNSEEKTRWQVQVKKPKYVESLKYKFGSNHLFIGRGLINVLEYLEDRYNIDFAEMEKNIRSKP